LKEVFKNFKNFDNGKKLSFLPEILKAPAENGVFGHFCFFASFFQRKKRGSKGRRPLGRTAPP